MLKVVPIFTLQMIQCCGAGSVVPQIAHIRKKWTTVHDSKRKNEYWGISESNVKLVREHVVSSKLKIYAALAANRHGKRQ